jgi:uncharacterized Zn finger protein
MSCARCSGLVVSDQYTGLEGELIIRRCINCGAVRESRMDLQGKIQPPIKRKEPRHRCSPRRHKSALSHKET